MRMRINVCYLSTRHLAIPTAVTLPIACARAFTGAIVRHHVRRLWGDTSPTHSRLYASSHGGGRSVLSEVIPCLFECYAPPAEADGVAVRCTLIAYLAIATSIVDEVFLCEGLCSYSRA